jgi:hypothetical protein
MALLVMVNCFNAYAKKHAAFGLLVLFGLNAFGFKVFEVN